MSYVEVYWLCIANSWWYCWQSFFRARKPPSQQQQQHHVLASWHVSASLNKGCSSRHWLLFGRVVSSRAAMAGLLLRWQAQLGKRWRQQNNQQSPGHDCTTQHRSSLQQCVYRYWLVYQKEWHHFRPILVQCNLSGRPNECLLSGAPKGFKIVFLETNVHTVGDWNQDWRNGATHISMWSREESCTSRIRWTGTSTAVATWFGRWFRVWSSLEWLLPLMQITLSMNNRLVWLLLWL